MARVLLVHWNQAEWNERAERLRKLGYSPEPLGTASPGSLKAIRDNPPDLIAIDLDRIPSHGREVAVALRQSKATRLVPVVFLNGDPEKVARIKELIPDARYTAWDRASTVFESALKERPKEAVVPCALSGYEPADLPKKLGIRPGVSVRLLHAPEPFAASLQPVELVAKAAHLVISFIRTRAELPKRFAEAVKAVEPGGSLWIVWPKKTSALARDLTQPEIREFCLAREWVDFKICAIDKDWSGLRFTRRRQPGRVAPV